MTKARYFRGRKEKLLERNLIKSGFGYPDAYRGTVDGSEIRRSPVEVGSLSNYLQGFSTIPGGCLGFLPSTVW